MKRRKERSEEIAEKEPENSGELRVIVADAKAAAAKEEIEIVNGSSGPAQRRSSKLSAPAPAVKPRPNSFAGAEVNPSADTGRERTSSYGRKLEMTQQESFEKEFIPPPPVLDSEDQSNTDEGTSRVCDW